MTGLVVVRLELLRLRVGEHRVLYRELADEANARYLVARVIDRRDLHRAIDKLRAQTNSVGHTLVCLPTPFLAGGRARPTMGDRRADARPYQFSQFARQAVRATAPCSVDPGRLRRNRRARVEALLRALADSR
jgi:hypothetical protein